MSKSARKAKHDKKMQRKRAVKATRRTAYAAMAGTSKRAKRQRKKGQIAGNLKHAHAMNECGNPGCQSCHPRPRMHGASTAA